MPTRPSLAVPDRRPPHSAAASAPLAASPVRAVRVRLRAVVRAGRPRAAAPSQVALSD